MGLAFSLIYLIILFTIGAAACVMVVAGVKFGTEIVGLVEIRSGKIV